MSLDNPARGAVSKFLLFPNVEYQEAANRIPLLLISLRDRAKAIAKNDPDAYDRALDATHVSQNKIGSHLAYAALADFDKAGGDRAKWEINVGSQLQHSQLKKLLPIREAGRSMDEAIGRKLAYGSVDRSGQVATLEISDNNYSNNIDVWTRGAVGTFIANLIEYDPKLGPVRCHALAVRNLAASYINPRRATTIETELGTFRSNEDPARSAAVKEWKGARLGSKTSTVDDDVAAQIERSVGLAVWIKSIGRVSQNKGADFIATLDEGNPEAFAAQCQVLGANALLNAQRRTSRFSQKPSKDFEQLQQAVQEIVAQAEAVTATCGGLDSQHTFTLNTNQTIGV